MAQLAACMHAGRGAQCWLSWLGLPIGLISSEAQQAEADRGVRWEVVRLLRGLLRAYMLADTTSPSPEGVARCTGGRVWWAALLQAACGSTMWPALTRALTPPGLLLHMHHAGWAFRWHCQRRRQRSGWWGPCSREEEACLRRSADELTVPAETADPSWKLHMEVAVLLQLQGRSCLNMACTCLQGATEACMGKTKVRRLAGAPRPVLTGRYNGRLKSPEPP